MKNHILSWRRSINSSQNPLLLEGIFDIGLPPYFTEEINNMFDMTSPKGRTILGRLLKKTSLTHSFGHWNTDNRALLNMIVDIFIKGVHRLLDREGVDWKGDAETLNKVTEVLVTFQEMMGRNTHVRDWSKYPSIEKVEKAIKFAVKTLTKGVISKLIQCRPPRICDNTERDKLIEKILSHKSGIYEGFRNSIFDRSIPLFPWLRSHPDAWREMAAFIEESDQEEQFVFWYLTEAAQNMTKGKDHEAQILHKFDDGYYWYDLETSDCSLEAQRMGHCGGDARAETLYSLRSKKEKKKISSSHITIAFSKTADKIYQIKGKANDAPEEKYWPKIAWLINRLGDPNILETGEHSKNPAGLKKMNDWLREHTDSEVVDPEKSLEDRLTEIKNAFDIQYSDSYSSIEMHLIYNIQIPTLRLNMI